MKKPRGLAKEGTMSTERRRTEAGLPILQPKEKAGLKDFWEAYEACYDEINRDLMKLVEKIPTFAAILKGMNPQLMAEQQKVSKERMRRALLADDWKTLIDNQSQEGGQYAMMGITFLQWFELISALHQIMVPYLVNAHSKSPEKLSAAILGM